MICIVTMHIEIYFDLNHALMYNQYAGKKKV